MKMPSEKDNVRERLRIISGLLLVLVIAFLVASAVGLWNHSTSPLAELWAAIGPLVFMMVGYVCGVKAADTR